jgi:hypothetical protein
MQYLVASSYFLSMLHPDILPNILLEENFCVLSLSVRDSVSHPYKTTGKSNL